MIESISIVDKVRAIFGVNQNYELHVDVMNDALSDMFQDRGLQLPLNENVEEALSKESIHVEDDYFVFSSEKLVIIPHLTNES